MAAEDDQALFSTGAMQHVTGMTPERFEKLHEYAIKSRTHMWVSLVQYIHSNEVMTRAIKENESLIMDRDNLIGHEIGCFICEEPATNSIMSRACKGEPKGTLRYV